MHVYVYLDFNSINPVCPMENLLSESGTLLNACNPLNMDSGIFATCILCSIKLLDFFLQKDDSYYLVK